MRDLPLGSEAFVHVRDIYAHRFLSTLESANTVAGPRCVFAEWATTKRTITYYHVYVMVLAIVVVVVVAKIVVVAVIAFT